MFLGKNHNIMAHYFNEFEHFSAFEVCGETKMEESP